MVFVRIPEASCDALSGHLDHAGVKAVVYPRTRLVTHLDVDEKGIDLAVDAFGSFFRKSAAAD
jgi:threonine aldolase